MISESALLKEQDEILFSLEAQHRNQTSSIKNKLAFEPQLKLVYLI